MTSSRFSFLRRVRIHGGECGAVARALHHAAQKVALVRNEQTLISDEKAFSRQAEPKKAFGSTIERKQMSTKTTLKRIALVAVSALGFGLMSVVPAKADAFQASYTAPTTVTVLEGQTTAATVGTIQINLTAPSDDVLESSTDTATVTLTNVNEGATPDALVADSLISDTMNTAFFNALSVVVDVAPSTANALYNVQNNSSVSVAGGKAAALSTTANLATASGRALVRVDRAALNTAIAALSSTDEGKVSGTAVVSYVFSATATDGLRQSATGYLVLSWGASVAGATTLTPSTGESTLTAGGTGSYTFAQPFTAFAGSTVTGSSFSLGTSTAVGATVNVTATATGGSVTVVRTGANEFTSTLLKDGNTGALSVTYTVTVTAPASSENGQTVVVNRNGAAQFTFRVFGGQTWNGTVATTRTGGATGWLAGTNEIYAPVSSTAATSAGTIRTNTSVTTPTLRPSWIFSMTGVGSFSVVGQNAGAINSGARTSYLTVTAGVESDPTVTLWSDGRAGKGTLTISANGNVVATQVVNFYGPATSIKVTPVYTIAEAGNGTSGNPAGALDSDSTGDCGAFGIAVCADTSTASTNDPALVVEVLDANGTRLPLRVGQVGEVLVSSSNTAVISSTTTSFLDAGVPTKTAGVLVNHVIYSSTAASKSGDKATLTFTHVNSLGATITATQAVSVGGKKTGGTVTMTTDKTTYAPGEKMILTLKALDSSGNKVADNIAIGTLASNKSIVGLPGATNVYVDGQFVYGDESGENLYAPATSGAFAITLASGTATGAEVKLNLTVGDDSATAAATAASDAALEAIDAANAATDAANLAAEAADAATVAAEEARDAADAATAAVEALASEVATLIAGLKAQITTLANTVAKIAKRVRA